MSTSHAIAPIALLIRTLKIIATSTESSKANQMTGFSKVASRFLGTKRMSSLYDTAGAKFTSSTSNVTAINRLKARKFLFSASSVLNAQSPGPL